MKILLAEDDSHVREELTELLSEAGHELTTAADGIEAFEKFRDDEAIELLLLDIRMPRCTGLQTLDAINKLNAQQDRVYESIFITGNNDSDAIISAVSPSNVHAARAATMSGISQKKNRNRNSIARLFRPYFKAKN